MRIAIIDSGIDYSHRRLKNCKISGISISRNKSEDISYSENYKDYQGHGTACAGIIYKIIPSAELVGVKIFQEGKITDEKSIVAALSWCIEQNNIKIINMSIGISDGIPSKDLTDICNKAFDAGIIIVAAKSNNINRKTYPADYPFVFGVVSGQIRDGLSFGQIADSDTDFIAKGSIQRVAYMNNADKIVSGTSYATPHLTGIIGSYLQKEMYLSFSDIQKKLSEDADETIRPLQISNSNDFQGVKISNFNESEFIHSIFERNRKFSFIQDILIFPISEKEMSAFSLFAEQCVFNIKQRLDYPRILTSFKSANDIDHRNISIDEALDSVDTLVLGYFQDNLWEGNVVYGNELIEKAINRGKNFFVYDITLNNYIKQKISEKERENNIYIPSISKEIYRKLSNFEYLPPVKCPILMVLGTGSKQGKFTTQLRIREILERENVNYSHLASEPQGELFGAEFTYPFGYKNAINLNNSEQTIFLRNLTKLLCDFKKPEILLTGTQGGLIPRHPLDSSSYSLSADSVAFVHGVLPDIIICTISPEDSIEIIENTVKVANIYTKCHTIFFVLTPWVRLITPDILNELDSHNHLIDEAYEIKRSEFEKHLKKPVLNIMDRKNDAQIIKLIENACS